MKVKIQHTFNGKITEEEITPIYMCHHVKGYKPYPTLNEVKFDETTEYILIENHNSSYGFSALWLKDKKNKIYEYDGFGHSGACSIVCSLLQKLIKDKQQVSFKMNTTETIKRLESELIETKRKLLQTTQDLINMERKYNRLKAKNKKQKEKLNDYQFERDSLSK